ncbi:hypothetical protein Ahy_B01g053046 [Arachis hypogaea]|uniref:Aminotransferase-like plant mobile domain-containing protein n=1 Tax=Arachis hypogaea TaxID=3818 RepID=A0A445AR23_ARAHY|nr:hypothetical protein Ahy_B01g053046 [Arachis hypogaea]
MAHADRVRLFFSRRVSRTLAPPNTIILYLREAGFGDTVSLRDFVFDNSLITAFVDCWRPETYTFHLLWGEYTITLQDIAYLLGLYTYGEPMDGASMIFRHSTSTRPVIGWSSYLVPGLLMVSNKVDRYGPTE